MGNFALNNAVLNQNEAPAIWEGPLADFPVAGFTGRLLVSTDTFALYRDNGAGFDLIGGPGTGTVTGSGTVGTIPLWSGTSVIGNSNVLQDSNGSVSVTTSGNFYSVLGVTDNGYGLQGSATGATGVGIYANSINAAGLLAESSAGVPIVANTTGNGHIIDFKKAGVLLSYVDNSGNFIGPSGSGYVPYTGATASVNLGSNSLTAGAINGTTITGGIGLYSGTDIYIRYNGYFLQGRNGADNAYIPLIRVNASDHVEIDANGYGAVFGGDVSASGGGSFTSYLKTNTTNPGSWQMAVGTSGANGYKLYNSTTGPLSAWDTYYDASYGGISRYYGPDGATVNVIIKGDGSISAGVITATSFIKSGGTSSQSLMADGTIQTELETLYTPTITALSNISSSASYVCRYFRFGNFVAVFGLISITPTIANTATSFYINTPVTTNFSAIESAGGTGSWNAGTNQNLLVSIEAIPSSSNIGFYFYSDTLLSSRFIPFTLMFLIE